MTKTEIDVLREYLQLDPTIPSGLRWIKSTNGRIKSGQPAGSPNSDGYYQFRLHRKHYKCHRVILLLNGVVPPAGCSEVDHLDRNPANNLLSNLRWVNRASNVRNCGVKGRIPWRYVQLLSRKFTLEPMTMLMKRIAKHLLTALKTTGSPNENCY
jgi:hypothetical protein